jgi:2-keto-4-pentenoate hydratase/2-oxohepta-3-ene-1,7-dioic acid hydratase in catechol pathway
MKLVTFSHLGSTHPHVGVLEADAVACLTKAGIADEMLQVIAGGAAVLTTIRQTSPQLTRHALDTVTLHAPLRPGKVLCSGINYRGHALENPNAKMPEEPFFFAKLPSSITGPEAGIVKSPLTNQLDYEVEFAVVIGRPLHRPRESEVMPAIFGYTLLNDVSARDVQFKDNQITLGKNFAGFAPIGPCILTADAMPHPDRVALKTRLNGRVMQDGSTSDWLFSLPRLIGHLAQVMPLEPGDIVTTGTPAGVGLFQKPPVFMNPGDVIEIEAEGIGTLRNWIVAP